MLCQRGCAPAAMREHSWDSWPQLGSSKGILHSLEHHGQDKNWEKLAGRGQSLLSDQAEHQAVSGEQLCWASLYFVGVVHSHSRIRYEVGVNICISFAQLIFHYQANNRLTYNLPVHTALHNTQNHFLKYMQEWFSITKACITMPQKFQINFFNLT